jgi:predicted glycogen debranching enzyme
MRGKITIKRDRCQDLDQSSRREWLEADGLGNFAAGTVAGANTRRYHGLLVASRAGFDARQVLLSRVEECVTQGGSSRDLGCAFYPDSVVPHGYSHLQSFELSPFPTWSYALPRGRLVKTVAMVHGVRGTILRYQASGTGGPVTLRIRVLVAARDFHALTQCNDVLRGSFDRQTDTVVYAPYDGVPPLTFLLPPGAGVVPSGAWYYRNTYPVELERGFWSSEDLFVPFEVEVPLLPNAPVELMVLIDPIPLKSPAQLLTAERTRRGGLHLHGMAASNDGDRLARAADQFLVKRQDGQSTILAGYPWLPERGREVFLSLPGLCLGTGRLKDARDMLRTWLNTVEDGLVPLHLGHSLAAHDFASADTTLWLFRAAELFLAAAPEETELAEVIYRRLGECLDRHLTGTRHNIRVDPADGLLSAADSTLPLTWMAERADSWVVTPRRGKAVEINALFYRALRFAEVLAQGHGTPQEQARWAQARSRLYESFERTFFVESAGHLADVIREDGSKDLAFRPNQLIAIAVAPELMGKPRARAVLGRIEERLLTPFGLRTLAAGDPLYQPRCEGGPHQRSSAYHNGSVWPFLLGFWADAVFAVAVDEKAARARVETLVASLLGELATGSGLGSLSEIYDAEEPRSARGCFAYAPGVAEAIRVLQRLSAARGRMKQKALEPAPNARRASVKRSAPGAPARKERKASAKTNGRTTARTSGRTAARTTARTAARTTPQRRRPT